MPQSINVGLVGYKFMGKAHSNAYRQVAHFFPDVACYPIMKQLCERDAVALREAADHLGRQEVATDWRRLVARDDIDLIGISTPGDTRPHRHCSRRGWSGYPWRPRRPYYRSRPDAARRDRGREWLDEYVHQAGTGAVERSAGSGSWVEPEY